MLAGARSWPSLARSLGAARWTAASVRPNRAVTITWSEQPPFPSFPPGRRAGGGHWARTGRSRSSRRAVVVPARWRRGRLGSAPLGRPPQRARRRARTGRPAPRAWHRGPLAGTACALESELAQEEGGRSWRHVVDECRAEVRGTSDAAARPVVAARVSGRRDHLAGGSGLKSGLKRAVPAAQRAPGGRTRTNTTPYDTKPMLRGEVDATRACEGTCCSSRRQVRRCGRAGIWWR